MAPYLTFFLAIALFCGLVAAFIALLATTGTGMAIGIYVAALGIVYLLLRTF